MLLFDEKRSMNKSRNNMLIGVFVLIGKQNATRGGVASVSARSHLVHISLEEEAEEVASESWQRRSCVRSLQ
jgi:hypothetical protein